MNIKVARFVVLSFVLCFVFTSCDNNNNLDIPDAQSTDTQSTEDNTNAELNIIKVFQNINVYGISDNDDKSFCKINDTINNVIRTINGNSIILNFALSNDQKGKIFINFSGTPTFSNSGLTAVITFENYSFNNLQIIGTVNMTMRHNIDTIGPDFTINADTLKFIKEDKSFLWGGKRNIIWDTGFFSLGDRLDDVYLIYGNTWGVNTKGVQYRVEIEKDNPLKKALSCEWIKQGKMTLTDYIDTEDEKSLTIDYAPGKDDELGQCDSWITITVKGFTFKVILNK